MAFDL